MSPPWNRRPVVRTALDEKGLLKPAYYGTKGYRFYETELQRDRSLVSHVIPRHFGVTGSSPAAFGCVRSLLLMLTSSA